MSSSSSASLAALRLLVLVICASMAQCAAVESVNPAWQGFLNLPLCNAEEEIKVEIAGSIPTWLNGSLYRNGPAHYKKPILAQHWFYGGFAMIHGFHFSSGAVTYSHRFVNSTSYQLYCISENITCDVDSVNIDPCKVTLGPFMVDYHEGRDAPEQEGLPIVESSGTRLRRNDPRLATMFPSRQQRFSAHDDDDDAPPANVTSSNTLITITRVNGSTVAYTGDVSPNAFDSRTVRTTEAPLVFDDAEPYGHTLACEHTHTDPNGQLFHYYYRFNVQNQGPAGYLLYTIHPETRTRVLLGEVPVNPQFKAPCYQHSFGLTENYVIISECPITFGPFINDSSFHADMPTTWRVASRLTGQQVYTFTSPAFMMYHHINAYEIDNTIVVDLVTYPNNMVWSGLYLKVILFDWNMTVSALRDARAMRFVLPMKNNNSFVSGSVLADVSVELPTISYAQHNTRPYTYFYAVSSRTDQSTFFDQIVKVNVETGAWMSWHEEGTYPGEPIFVPSPNSVAEDDGLLLSVLLEVEKGRSSMLVLNATTFEVIGRATVPLWIPFGFHGRYYTNETPWS